jgi:hypothetical protein
MNIENDPTETDRMIVQMLARSLKPKPVQEIADEIQKSYKDTLQHLGMINKLRPLRYFNLPNGILGVELVTVPAQPKV